MPTLPVSLLMRKLGRLEKTVQKQAKSLKTIAEEMPSPKGTVAIQIPTTASEALNDLKSEISKSSCKDNRIISDRLSFLTSKMSGGTRRKSKVRKSKKTRKH
jgi:hypothetical protein